MQCRVGGLNETKAVSPCLQSLYSYPQNSFTSSAGIAIWVKKADNQWLLTINHPAQVLQLTRGSPSQPETKHTECKVCNRNPNDAYFNDSCYLPVMQTIRNKSAFLALK